jgi:hypothetical protein
VTSTVIQRGGAAAADADRARDEQNTQTIIDALTETRNAIAQLDKRLSEIATTTTE